MKNKSGEINMEYKEEYNKALERAKKGMPIEEVFPELKESEDERIRKWLIEMIEEVRKANPTNAEHNGNCSEAIAYLEKQKELDKCPEYCVRSNCIGCSIYEKQKEQKWSPSEGEMGVLYKLCYISNQITDEDDTELTRLYQDLKREYFNGHSFENMFLNEKQKEQNPADISELMVHIEPYIAPVPTPIVADEQKPIEWSEEEKLLEHAIDWLIIMRDKYALTNEAKEDISRIVFELKSLPERFVLQPKQELSEGEIKVLDSIIDDYEKAAKSFCGYDVKILFLKAIRNGEYDLSKQEWSEEDKALIENVCTDLKGYALHERKVDLDEHAHRLEEMSERLKSLRPQPKHKQKETVLHWESGHPEPYKSVLILRHGSVVVEGEWNEETGRWYQYGFQSYLKDNEVDGWMNKKSLLFDNFKFCHSWKPSEEQMKILRKYVMGEWRDLTIGQDKLLTSLYNDLQKLL